MRIHPTPAERIEAEQRLALIAQALRQAPALRREAIENFWRDADAALAATLDSAGRSGARLGHRLARHLRGRHTTLEG